jgi:hypothetical protein
MNEISINLQAKPAYNRGPARKLAFHVTPNAENFGGEVSF